MACLILFRCCWSPSATPRHPSQSASAQNKTCLKNFRISCQECSWAARLALQAPRPQSMGRKKYCGSRTYSTGARRALWQVARPGVGQHHCDCCSASHSWSSACSAYSCYWSIRQPPLQWRGLGPGPFQQEAHCVDSVHLEVALEVADAHSTRSWPACALEAKGWGLWPDPGTWGNSWMALVPASADSGCHLLEWQAMASPISPLLTDITPIPALGPEGQNGESITGIPWEGACPTGQ